MDNLLKEYVGDKVEFVTKDGLVQKKLYYTEVLGLYVIHNNDFIQVKHWGNDSVPTRLRAK